MDKQIKVFDHIAHQVSEVLISESVDVCPICNRGTDAQLYNAYFVGKSQRKDVQVIYQCTFPDCSNMFIATYKFNENEKKLLLYKLTSVLPKSFVGKIFSSEVTQISNSFEKIYNQTKQAENSGLNEIAGAGYRKALEFLIKDYLISLLPAEKDKIIENLLGVCINDYVKNDNIKICASRAVWLGNDLTHYYRKWETHDIENLKDLIDLTVNWIESEIKTKKYFKEMPKKK